jgi:hypothetical protein
MDRSRLQWSLTAFLAIVASCALNFWLFRLGVLWGLLGLSLSKHVLVAWLCQTLGVDRKNPESTQATPALSPVHPADLTHP